MAWPSDVSMALERDAELWPVSPHGRPVLVAVLLLSQLGLLVWFGTLEPDPSLGRYPAEAHLADDYDAYVGERVSIDRMVVATDPVTIRADHPDGSLSLVVADVDHSVAEREFLQVYGVVGPGGTIWAIGSFTVSPSGRWYA